MKGLNNATSRGRDALVASLALLLSLCVGTVSAADARGYAQSGLIAQWDGVENVGRFTHESTASTWVDLVAGRAFALTGVTVGDDRLTFAGSASSYGLLSDADTKQTFDMVGAGGTIEVVLKANSSSDAVALQSSTVVLSKYRSGSIVFCGSAGKPMLGWCWDAVKTNTVSMYYKNSLVQSAAVNGSSVGFSGEEYFSAAGSGTVIGSRRALSNTHFNGSIYAIRLYDRALTADEIAANAALDDLRFRQGGTNAYENAVVVKFDQTEPLGAVSPSYGVTNNLVAGRDYVFTAPACATNAAATVAYRCAGWKLSLTNGTDVTNTSSDVRSCALTYGAAYDGATLMWKWEVTHYKLDTSVSGQGSVDVAPQFVTTNGSVAITATPSAGWKFWKWTGDGITAANRYGSSLTVTMDAAKSVTANFYEVAKAVPTNVYVSVNGSGDLSGCDEENAARNLTSAYAACAANPVGGTVHVAGGIYRSTAWSSTKGNFTANAALTPAPYVTLVGSSDTNNPTILTGDRGLDDKWDYNGASQWSNGKLVLPPLGVATLPRTGSDDSNFISSSERAEGCRFENLTIHGFTSTAVSMTYATNAVFANCRFVGIGHTSAHPSLRCLTISQAPVVVTNCLFVGHVSALGFESGAGVTMTIMDSLIRAGVNWGAYSASCPPGIYNSANVTVKLVRTTVRDTQSGNPTMCAASGYWNCQDCSFINIYSSGNCTFHANGGGTFAGCAFLTNKVSTTATGYYSSACVGGNGDFSFSDCYFGGNKLTKTKGASNSDGSVLSTEAFNTYTFVNCTAEDNCVTSTAGKAANACTVGGWRPQNFAIANCVFRNNSNIDATGTRRPEFRAIRTNSDTGNSPMFVNSIVRNSAENFVAFPYTKDSSEHRRFGVAACDIQGYVAPTAGATGNGFSYAPIVDVEPCLAAAARHEGPRGARPPTRETPREVARGAVRVYKATNGYFYFLDTHVKPNQWRKIAIANDGGSKVSLADGLKIGLDPSKPAHPDVFGTRRRLRPAMGPADTPPIGAVLSLR